MARPFQGRVAGLKGPRYIESTMIHPGDVVSLSVEKPAAGGRMIARHEGRVVLVGGAIPGERVRARVSRVARGLAYAETVSLDERSPDRRDWGADPQCGGCLYGHIAYSRQLEIKSAVIADAFARIGRLPLPSPVPVAASPEDAYRMRARFHVRGGRWGFFREGSHDLCDARPTRQLRADTCDALDALMTAARSLALDALQQIELAENADCSSRAAFLDSSLLIGSPALDRLAGCAGFTGIAAAEGVHGDAHVTDTVELAGRVLRLRRHVQAFFQGNRFLLPAVVGHVVDQLPQGAEVVDLYAGGGLFSIAAAAVRDARVTAIEADRVAAADLRFNAAAVEGVTPVHEAVEDFVARGFRPASGGVVIVDPPRTGMSREAAHGVVNARAPRLVYVSCDVATLARDARRMVDAGYELRRVDAFDLFPNTPHVETVAVFDLACAP